MAIFNSYVSLPEGMLYQHASTLFYMRVLYVLILNLECRWFLTKYVFDLEPTWLRLYDKPFGDLITWDVME